MDDYVRHLETLGLEPGASFDEVRHAYADLCAVWHPSKFEGDSRFQGKARAMLEDLDEAYRFLSARFERMGERTAAVPSHRTAPSRPTPPPPPPPRPRPRPPPPDARDPYVEEVEAVPKRKTRRPERPKAKKAKPKSRPVGRSPSRWVRITATLAAIGFVAWVVVADPELTKVRSGASYAKQQIDVLLERASNTGIVRRFTGRGDGGEASGAGSGAGPVSSPAGFQIPETLQPLTRGRVVRSLPDLSMDQVLARFGQPNERSMVRWRYERFDVLFMDSVAMLLVRDSVPN